MSLQLNLHWLWVPLMHTQEDSRLEQDPECGPSLGLSEAAVACSIHCLSLPQAVAQLEEKPGKTKHPGSWWKIQVRRQAGKVLHTVAAGSVLYKEIRHLQGCF